MATNNVEHRQSGGIRMKIMGLVLFLLCSGCAAMDAGLQPASGGSGAPGRAAYVDTVTGMEFTAVPGGCFLMGDVLDIGDSYERPVHEVCLKELRIGTYEVTQAQWQRVMGDNPSRFKSCGQYCPVENVSYSDVQGFIEKLNAQSGRNYRLPTEAEWEYACRGGGKPEKFCGGADVEDVAWYAANSFSSPQPVGQKRPNGLGIYDMSGNVWEWVQDYMYNYLPNKADNPTGPSAGTFHIVRGGAWDVTADATRSSYRNYVASESRKSDLGFRLVAPLTP
ncbi:formylglycine-generating enzyme family protein [Oryzomonas rubra]|uniref:Formylglycine-generating enzyme family protein n=2 Tax=Oryzomonas rubra TaxID=2509454 RepID=A0A5A9X952_9BACT|nr:formylglycine-generating enzyme family protein [Oryzomonas rubra]